MTAAALQRLEAAQFSSCAASKVPLNASAVSRIGARSMPLDLAFVTERAGFDSLETEWNQLFEASAQPSQMFLSFNWLWHWCNHYLAGQSLSILTGRRDGRLVMIWPLVKWRVHGLSVLSFMGEPMSQYGDVLVEAAPDTPDCMRMAWAFLKSRSGADFVRLGKVRTDSAIASLLMEAGGRITDTQVAPYLDLSNANGYAEYEKRYSGSSRKKRRNLIRRLADLGPLTVKEVTGGPEARTLVEFAIPLKRKWLVSRGLVSRAYSDDRITRFFGDVAEAAHKPAGCLVTVIRSAGRPAAVTIALLHKDGLGLHILVHDPDFDKLSAGTLLIEHNIRSAADRGLGCYDFLAPGDAYKLGWADASVEVNDWVLALSLAGRAYTRLYLAGMRECVKAAVAALPSPLRRMLAARISKAAAAT